MPATVAAFVVSGRALLADHGFMTLKPSPLPSASKAIASAVAIAAPASTPGQEMAERGTVSFSTTSVSMAHLIFDGAVTPLRATMFRRAPMTFYPLFRRGTFLPFLRASDR